MAMTLFPSLFSLRWLLLTALGAQIAAKILEVFDRDRYARSGGTVGGHAVKYLLAAASCWLVLEMLRRRRDLSSSLG